MFHIPETALFYGSLPGLAHLSMWLDNRVDEDECESLVQWQWQGTTLVPG